MSEERIARLEQQLGTTRRLVALLFVALLALAGVLAYSQLRPKRTLVLENADSTLTLEPSQLAIHSRRGSVVVGLSGITIDREAEPRASTRLEAGALTLANATGPTIDATTQKGDATLDVSTQFGAVHLVVDQNWSSLSVDRKAGPSVEISANGKTGEVQGHGGNAFDLGGPTPPAK